MAVQFKHKRYFRARAPEWNGIVGSNSDVRRFTSTSDANTKCGFGSAYNTSSPTKTLALADDNHTLVVTYEFKTLDEQTAFKSAVDSAYDSSGFGFDPENADDSIENFKTEWLNQDGSVSSTYNNADFPATHPE